MRVLLALGGNAMTAPDGSATPAAQIEAVGVAMRAAARLVAAGHQLVITHGNGPQVGNILVKNELAAHVVPPVPLDWCGAQTQGTRYTVAGEVGRAGGNHHPSICPYGLFTCADGMIQLSCGSEGLWQRLAAGFGLDPFAPGFATNRERVGNRDAVIELLNAAFADIPHAELMARLAEIGVPAGEVRTLDRVYDWDQTRSQGLVIEVDHPVLGTIEIPGPPIRLDDNAYAGGRSEHLHPPLLGEHNESVRAWLDELDGSAEWDEPGDA
jgi:hypothetical protein